MEPTSRPDGLRGRVDVAVAAAWRVARAGRVAVADQGRGQGVVEYGLILSLSAALAVVLLFVFGGTLSAVLDAVGDAIDAAS
jgi:Flp pilus assembly pilin Flp